AHVSAPYPGPAPGLFSHPEPLAPPRPGPVRHERRRCVVPPPPGPATLMDLDLFVVVERLGWPLDVPLAGRTVPLDRPAPSRAAAPRPVVFFVHHLRNLLCFSGISMLVTVLRYPAYCSDSSKIYRYKSQSKSRPTAMSRAAGMSGRPAGANSGEAGCRPLCSADGQVVLAADAGAEPGDVRAVDVQRNRHV